MNDLFDPSTYHLLTDPDPEDISPEQDIKTIDGLTMFDSNFGRDNRYETTFNRVLSEGSFFNILSTRERQGKGRNVLDLFGGGYFMGNSLLIDHLFAVRMRDIDQPLTDFLSQKIEDEKLFHSAHRVYERLFNLLADLKINPRRKVLEGNLYREETWNQLRESMDNHFVPHFDLVVCRPEGAFKGIYIDLALKSKQHTFLPFILQLLTRAYEVCSPHAGEIFMQLPLFGMPQRQVFNEFALLPEFSKDFSFQIASIDSVYGESVIRITRRSERAIDFLTFFHTPTPPVPLKSVRP